MKVKLPQYKYYTLDNSPAVCNQAHGWNSAINQIKAMLEKQGIDYAQEKGWYKKGGWHGPKKSKRNPN